MVFRFFSAPLADAWLARVSDAEDEGWLARVSEVEDDASGSCNWESWPGRGDSGESQKSLPVSSLAAV